MPLTTSCVVGVVPYPTHATASAEIILDVDDVLDEQPRAEGRATRGATRTTGLNTPDTAASAGRRLQGVARLAMTPHALDRAKRLEANHAREAIRSAQRPRFVAADHIYNTTRSKLTKKIDRAHAKVATAARELDALARDSPRGKLYASSASLTDTNEAVASV